MPPAFPPPIYHNWQMLRWCIARSALVKFVVATYRTCTQQGLLSRPSALRGLPISHYFPTFSRASLISPTFLLYCGASSSTVLLVPFLLIKNRWGEGGEGKIPSVACCKHGKNNIWKIPTSAVRRSCLPRMELVECTHLQKVCDSGRGDSSALFYSHECPI